MTIREYITDKFLSFGIELSASDMIELCRSMDGDDQVEPNWNKVQFNICKFIPSLLARPTSMSEGGMSMAWDKGAIKEYYAFLCAELNLPNKLEPTIKFISLR